MHTRTNATTGTPAVTVEGLSKTFREGAEAVVAVDDVSFAVEEGAVTGLLGPNGAGKTTTIKAILGLLLPTAGTVRINGVDPHESPGRAYREVSAVLEGARNVYWRLSVAENLRFFAGLHGNDPRERREDHGALLRTFDLEDKRDEPVRDLSRGMKQKVAIACTLVRETPVVFLDEPTLGLDVETSRTLRRELRRMATDEGRTVVPSSHDMDVVEDVCDRVVVMNEGRVVADDTVAGLVDVFDAQSYRFELDGALPEAVADRFDVYDVTETPDGVSFEVVLSEARELYDVFGRLADAGVVVTDVASTAPDLEEVFLRVTDDGSEGVVVER